MIRILYVTRAKLSLSRAHTYNILKTAEFLGRETDIRMKVFSGASEARLAREIKEEKNIEGSLEINVAHKRRLLVAGIWRARHDFDVLYFRDPFLLFSVLFTRYILRKKIIFEVHGSYEWKYFFWLWRLVARQANGLVFITKRLRATYHPNVPSIVTHPEGVDFGAYSQVESRDRVRNILGLPQEKILVMYAGSFMWYSLKTFAELGKYLKSNEVLVLVGVTQNDEKELLGCMTKEGVPPEKYIFIKRVKPKDIPAYLFAADVLVNPLGISYPSSLSSKLYGYLASGRPIITTRGGANDEVIRHGENGYVVGLAGKEFAEALHSILSNEALKELLSHNASKDAQQYTWENRTKAIASLIRQI